MLGKLIKQELKVTSRLFIPMYIALGVMTLLVKLTSGTTFGNHSAFGFGAPSNVMNLITGLLVMVYIFVIIGIVLLTYFIIIRRFYTNMFGDEGYLMFTLPVSTGQLMNSKLIVAFIWQFVMIPAMLLSFFILFVNTEVLRQMPIFFSDIAADMHTWEISGFRVGLLSTEIILGMLLEMFSVIITFYLSITLGHHLWSQHRFSGSILAFLGISIIESFIGSFVSWRYVDVIPVDFFSAFQSVVPATLIVDVILFAIYYTLTHYLLDKKLNLD